MAIFEYLLEIKSLDEDRQWLVNGAESGLSLICKIPH